MDLNKVLFSEGSYENKKEVIDRLTENELMSVSEDIVREIIEKNVIADVTKKFYISKEFVKGNGWNSDVEMVYIHCGKLYVQIYVQNTKTDASMVWPFDDFFTKKRFESRDNYLRENVTYNVSQKAEVMRSILLECVYRLYSSEAARRAIIDRLTDYKIINPIVNEFYGKLRVKELSKYCSDREVKQLKGYYHAKQALQDMIKEHCMELKDMDNDALTSVYKKVFEKEMNEFAEKFDVGEWRRNTILWY